MTTQQQSHQHQHQHQQGDLTVYRSSSNQSDFAFCFGGRSGSVEHLQERFLLDFQEPLGHGNRRFLSKRDLDIQRFIDIYDLHGQDRWDFQKNLLKSFFVRYDLIYDLISMRVGYYSIFMWIKRLQHLATHWDCPPVGHPFWKIQPKTSPWGTLEEYFGFFGLGRRWVLTTFGRFATVYTDLLYLTYWFLHVFTGIVRSLCIWVLKSSSVCCL